MHIARKIFGCRDLDRAGLMATVGGMLSSAAVSRRRAPGKIRAVRRVCLVCLVILSVVSNRTSADTNSIEALSTMSIEELMNVKVSAATLGGSDLRRAPAAITTITSADIRDSGARNLDELLEIYVPNSLYLRHSWEEDHFGIRGIIGDEDNKFLLLVNGRVMNNFVHAGAISERDLGLLGDIQEIRVVRGPGSAVYGAGALIGVIDIKTFDGTTFHGTEATVRAGEGDEFYTAEIKSGFDLGGNAHVFLYGGISDLAGANNSASPWVPGISGPAYNGSPVVAGQDYPPGLPRDGRMFLGLPPLKLHGELTIGDFTLWSRLTRGGEVQPFDQRWLVGPPEGFKTNQPPGNYVPQGVGYEQISAGADYRHEINDQWSVAGRLGYGLDDYVRTEFDGPIDANREDIYTARLLATWKSSDTHSLTFGAEYWHGEFGLPTFGYSSGPAISTAFVGIAPSTPNGESAYMPRWSSDTYSFLGEDRWDMAPDWSLFTDLRMDKNDRTDYMFSPRAALIYTPTDKDTFKLILSQAVKADVAEELEVEREVNGVKDDTETLRAAELDYNRLLGRHVSLGINTFFNDFYIIGWDNNNNRSQPAGNVDIVGAELELSYHARHFQAGLSHGFSQLVDFRNAVQGTEAQAISSEPYGFGHDVNHWSTHITKLNFTYRPVDRFRFTGSLRVFWGWPGWESYTAYANSIGVDSSGDPLDFRRQSGYNPYDGVQARLNLGAIYDVNKHLSLGLHGYNLLGLADPHLNDRFIMFSSSAQQDPVGVMMTVSCKF